jgi:ketosteroid isomerase-like protein
MKTRWVISLIVLVAFILLPQVSLADDLADLKATHQKLFAAFNSGDVETSMDLWLEGGIFLPASRAFPVVVNIVRGKKMWSRFFQTHMIIMTFYKPEFRVIGNTGLVWGHVDELMMNKEKGVGQRSFLKFSMTYVKTEGKWKVASYHSSPIPSKDKIF